MKKSFFTIILLLTLAMSVSAENYPYRNDVLWITKPDHTNWLYQCGEQAKITVEFFKYGIPADGKLIYTIATDMLDADIKDSVMLVGGEAVINAGTKQTPGFRDIRLTAKVNGQSYTHHIKIGFDADKIVPYTKMPDDFKIFWNKQISDMRKTPIQYTKEYLPKHSSDKFDCYRIKLNTVGTSFIYANLFIPKHKVNSADKCTYPVVLCPPGAGIKTIREPMRHKYYAENGMIRMEMEIHGLLPETEEAVFKTMAHDFDYITFNIQDKDKYYMKNVYLACIRAMDFLCSLPEWDGKNAIVQGGSQGGALSIITGALHEKVMQSIVNYPALSDMAAYREEGRTGGWPHLQKKKHIVLTDEVTNTLQYYDVVNFARIISCNVYMTWGYNDNSCPPTTSYAVWNSINAPKECLLTPINEHWASDATEYTHMLWIKKHLK